MNLGVFLYFKEYHIIGYKLFFLPPCSLNDCYAVTLNPAICMTGITLHSWKAKNHMLWLYSILNQANSYPLSFSIKESITFISKKPSYSIKFITWSVTSKLLPTGNTLLHARWSSTLSMERAIILTFLLANSGASFAALPSSVVHTGVKSRGWEKRMPHLSKEKKVTSERRDDHQHHVQWKLTHPRSKTAFFLKMDAYEDNWGFPGGASGKEPACQSKKCKRCGFHPWVRKIPWRRAWEPTPVGIQLKRLSMHAWRQSLLNFFVEECFSIIPRKTCFMPNSIKYMKFNKVNI